MIYAIRVYPFYSITYDEKYEFLPKICQNRDNKILCKTWSANHFAKCQRRTLQLQLFHAIQSSDDKDLAAKDAESWRNSMAKLEKER